MSAATRMMDREGRLALPLEFADSTALVKRVGEREFRVRVPTRGGAEIDSSEKDMIESLGASDVRFIAEQNENLAPPAEPAREAVRLRFAAPRTRDDRGSEELLASPLSERDHEALISHLEPPPPNAALRATARRYQAK